MAYPAPSRPAQRPPPMRQYNQSPASPAMPPGAYAQDAGFGPDYTAAGYAPEPAYEDPAYGYSGSPMSPPNASAQPRTIRPPPQGGRPPVGYDERRGYPGGRQPSEKRSRSAAGRRPPGAGPTFDNPFPAVPPGRDPRDPRDLRDPRSRGHPPRGLEQGMAAMDINGRPPPRPHTSNSNGRRPDMRGPPPRGPPPSRGRGGYYPGPPRSASAARMGEPPMGPPGRSATMPSGAPPMMYPAGPQQTFSDYDYAGSPISPVEAPLRPSTAGGMRHPPRPMNDSDSGLMIPPPPDPPNRVSYAPKEFLDSYYESGDEPEMPNFDAMPQTHMGPIDEMGLDAPRPAVHTPTSPSVTSPSGAYSPYTPDSAHGIPQSHSQPNMGNAEGLNQFENAGFHFDIPTEPPRQPEGYFPNSYEANGAAPYQHQARAPEPQHNPDALPVHPTPFRPGLDQKPPPIRQYNTAPITASAPAPTPAVAPQPARPVSMGPTPVTQEELQQLQQRVRGNPSDQATQLLLAKELVEAATVLVGDNNRLDPKTKAKAKEKYILDAHKIVKKLVQNGYADAQFYLADCYGEGQLGLEADPKEAFALYHSAAKSGHAQSAYRVAVCSEIGQEEGGGTKRDPFKAVQWYKRAAALGDTPAMYKMGMIHLKGLLGQARNPREGVSWLKRAAERADEENPHALHELALMYQNAGGNDVIIRDEKYANQLFHQAADLGYKFSQFRLGTAYEYGLMGNPVDNRMSIIWYTRAAAQGEHQSELALSGWYLTGSEGILQQNDTEAYLWARKAATAGLAKAEYAMGYFTEVGIGVSANLEDAKRWYWRAAAQGLPKARERLEDLKKGGSRMQKTRLSRSAVNKQTDGDCILM